MNSSPEVNKWNLANKRDFTVEFFAINFGLLYTILYIKEVEYCFVFAVLGAILYGYLCYVKQIFAESFLQGFYILTAIYGWFNWGEYGENSYSLLTHLIFLGVTFFTTVLVGFFLSKKTKSQLPFLDSFTTVFSITGTILMVNFVHETWLYLLAINIVSMVLYYRRGMKMSVLLYAFYVYLSLAGWFGFELIF